MGVEGGGRGQHATLCATSQDAHLRALVCACDDECVHDKCD